MIAIAVATGALGVATDAALQHGRPARDARPARGGVPAPAAPVARVLHADPHGRDPVADLERHRRRADGRHEHGDLDRLERDHGAGRHGRDVPARLAARARGPRAAALLRMAHAPRRRGAAAHHGRAPGPARRHVGARRGVAVGVRHPARQDDGPRAGAGRAVRERVRGARRPRGPLPHGGALAHGVGADELRRDAGADLPVRGPHDRGRRRRDHDRHAGRVHHPADAPLLPRAVAAVGRRRRAELARAVRAGVPLPRPAGRDRGARRRHDAAARER